MEITRAHKIRLHPTPEQEKYFWKAAGTARFAYNWALAEWNKVEEHNRKVYKTGEGEKIKVSAFSLNKRFTQEKPDWVREVLTYAPSKAILDVGMAVNRFFKLKKKGLLNPPKGFKGRKDGRPYGWPVFKVKAKVTPSFYLANVIIHLHQHHKKFWFDKKRVGWVKMSERLRFDGKIMGGRVTYKQGRWWLSVQVQFEIPDPIPAKESVGIDLGIKYLAVTSDNDIYQNPKAFEKARAELRILQRKLDRQRRANNPANYNEDGTVKKGRKEWVTSNRMKLTERRLVKAYARIFYLRQDASHKMTSEIAKRYGFIALEDLNVKGMLKNKRLSKAISDAAFYEKRRQLEYKSEYFGGKVVIIDRWFPSSKTCNNCGERNPDLKLHQRVWTCVNCGSVNERDLNAAKNILEEGIRAYTN